MSNDKKLLVPVELIEALANLEKLDCYVYITEKHIVKARELMDNYKQSEKEKVFYRKWQIIEKLTPSRIKLVMDIVDSLQPLNLEENKK